MFKNYAGVSLVETLIYISILSLIIAGLFSFSLTIAANRNKAYAAQEVQANIRSVVTTINTDVRMADAVLSPAVGATQTQLILDMGVNPDITYNVVNGVIYRTVGVGDPIAVSTSRVTIQNQTFKNLAEVGERDHIELTAMIAYISDDSRDFAYSRNLQTAFTIKK